MPVWDASNDFGLSNVCRSDWDTISLPQLHAGSVPPESNQLHTVAYCPVSGEHCYAGSSASFIFLPSPVHLLSQKRDLHKTTSVVQEPRPGTVHIIASYE